MYKRLAQQKKLNSSAVNNNTSTTEKLSREQIERKVQDELGLCKVSTVEIEHEKLLSTSALTNEEIVIMRRLVDDYVLRMTHHLTFPDINNLFNFRFEVSCVTRSKKNIVVGEENISLVENCLSPGSIVSRTSHQQMTEDVKNSLVNQQQQHDLNEVITYLFNIQVNDNYPVVGPTVIVESVSDSKRQQLATEACFKLFSSTTTAVTVNIQELIEKLKDIVVQIEKQDISERTYNECIRLLKIQNDCMQDSRFMLSEHLVKEGKSLMKSDTGVVKSAVYNGKTVAIKTLLYKTDGSELPELIEETNAVWYELYSIDNRFSNTVLL
jgi:hypothetical protein